MHRRLRCPFARALIGIQATEQQTIEAAIENPGDPVVISPDVAASETGKNGRIRLASDNTEMNSGALGGMTGKWLECFPVVSIEDPSVENDIEGMQSFTKCYGDPVQIIRDDYLVSNAKLVAQALSDQACTAVLVTSQRDQTRVNLKWDFLREASA